MPQTASETILLETESHEPAALGQMEARVDVSSKLKGRRWQFLLFDGHQLVARSASFSGKLAETRLNILHLDPDPVRQRDIDTVWLFNALGLALLGTLSLVLAATLDGLILTSVYGVMMLFTGALGSAYLCLRRSRDVLVFRSLHGRAPVLEFPSPGEGHSELGRFIGKIRSRIREHQEQELEDFQSFLRREMREHGRLKKQRILTEDQYDAAKARILLKFN